MRLPGMGADAPSLLGYGCMRFPLRPDGTVDEAQAARLIHRALQGGLRGYALAEALGVPVVVMEPVKGGSLAQLPDDACAPLLQLDPEATPAASRSGTGCPCTKTKRSPGGSGRGWTRRSGPACATAAANVSGAAPSISGSGPSWPR